MPSADREALAAFMAAGTMNSGMRFRTAPPVALAAARLHRVADGLRRSRSEIVRAALSPYPARRHGHDERVFP